MLEEVSNSGNTENAGVQVLEENGYRLTATISRRKTVNRLNVVLEGEVCLKNVNQLAKQLQPMVKEYDYLNLQLKNISEFDLSSIQLLWHLKRKAQNQGKTVAIVAQLSQEIQQVIKTAGLNKVISEK